MDKKNKDGGKGKQKASPKKKPELKDDEPGNDIDEEEEEEKKKQSNKPKNPLDSLPKSPMILDSVKRLFSNEAYETAVVKYWEGYDAEGYSMWEGAYQYNAENTVLFMTCNLIGGYLQRLESLRKYGFGALMVVGEDKGPYDVWGLFVVRGKEMPPELKECPDSEYYKWTHIDHTSDKDKKRVDELWHGSTINGKTVQERRFFK